MVLPQSFSARGARQGIEAAPARKGLIGPLVNSLLRVNNLFFQQSVEREQGPT
jgi:hypothetical protein